MAPPFLASSEAYLFFAAFFFPPFAFFAIEDPPLHGVDCASAAAPPAHSAAWHVGPACRRPRFVGYLLRAADRREQQLDSITDKKWGALPSTPKVKRKNYRFFAAFFFAALGSFFAIVFSSGCCDSASTNRLAVTTGGLSHPPSYQM